MRPSSDDVLLFFEDHDVDTYFKHDRRIRRAARRLYQTLRDGRPRATGFEVWFLLLRKALTRIGKRVHVNDRRLALRNPTFPVGICGYPQVLADWDLPNPAVLGPGLFDHPSIAPGLMNDRRFRFYVTTCDWYHQMFEPVYGSDCCVHWHAGIDTNEWPDLGARPKDLDVLVYDKVRWKREEYEETLLRPIREELERKGLRFEFLRYGKYDYDGYRSLLARSKAMIFLCEHETQGMAYQEAMASGVPILAWDPGTWVDPNAARYDPNPIVACSVPFFDPTCGERFQEPAGFTPAFERFWTHLASYAPRKFVLEKLSLEESGKTYSDYLARAGAGVTSQGEVGVGAVASAGW